MQIETKKVGKRLTEYRENKGWSQEKLAAYLGISRQAVSKWERGVSCPDTGVLLDLSKLYGVTINELLEAGNQGRLQTIEDLTYLMQQQWQQLEKLSEALALFSPRELVTAAMGVSPEVYTILMQLAPQVDFAAELRLLSPVSVSEVEALHARIVEAINSEIESGLK